MVSLAFRNLFQEKIRLSISVIGIASAVLLILIIEGLSGGLYKQVVAYTNNTGADLIVAQRGVDSMFSSRSTLQENMKDDILEVEGVEKALGIFAVPIMLVKEERKTPLYLIGYNLGENMGGPWKIAQGREPQTNKEVVFDLSLARRNDLEVGDKVDILGQKFSITGLSRETASWMNPYIFVSKEAASKLLSSPDSVSFFLISVEGSKIEKVKKEINRLFSGVDALTKEKMAAKDQRLLKEMMANIMNVMVTIAYIIGIMVIGLTIYTAVIEKIKEYGILKAMGAGNKKLYGIVLRQALISSVLGFFLGSLISLVIARLIETLFPQFLMVVGGEALMRTFIAAIIMSAIASIVPIRRIAQIDPVLVFKA